MFFPGRGRGRDRRQERALKILNSPSVEVTDLAPADLIDKCDIYLFQPAAASSPGTTFQVVVTNHGQSPDELVGVRTNGPLADMVPEYLAGIVHQLYAETLAGNYIQVQLFNGPNASVLVNTYPITGEGGSRVIGGLLVARPLTTPELYEVHRYVVGRVP